MDINSRTGVHGSINKELGRTAYCSRDILINYIIYMSARRGRSIHWFRTIGQAVNEVHC